MQVGGEPLYRDLEGDVTSVAAPVKDFFKRVLDGRKVIILIDELAQYVARFEAAQLVPAPTVQPIILVCVTNWLAATESRLSCGKIASTTAHSSPAALYDASRLINCRLARVLQ